MPAINKTAARSTKTVAAKKPVAKKAPARKAPAKKVVARPVKTAAELRKAEKLKAARIAELQSQFKPVKTVFNRSDLLDALADRSGLTKREVAKVYTALTELMMGSLMPKSVGEFTLPGIMKLVSKKIPAKKGGQKVMSFGVERISKPKAATVRVKARLLARVKQVALPTVH